MQVLVVDDQSFLAELVKLALEADGHGCLTVQTLEQADEVFRTVRIDLLAMDLVEAGRPPLEWLEALTLGRPELHGRVFVLTGRPLAEEETLRASRCGARVLPKPFTLHGLREAVTALESADRRSGNAMRTGGVPSRAGRRERPISEDS